MIWFRFFRMHPKLCIWNGQIKPSSISWTLNCHTPIPNTTWVFGRDLEPLTKATSISGLNRPWFSSRQLPTVRLFLKTCKKKIKILIENNIIGPCSAPEAGSFEVIPNVNLRSATIRWSRLSAECENGPNAGYAITQLDGQRNEM